MTGGAARVLGFTNPVTSGEFSCITLWVTLSKRQQHSVANSRLLYMENSFSLERMKMSGHSDSVLYLTCLPFLDFLKLTFLILLCFFPYRSLSPFYKAWLLLPKSAPSIVTTLNTPSW